MNDMQIELAGHKYLVGRLDAKRQFNVVRRLAPVIMGVIKTSVAPRLGKGAAPGKTMEEMLDALSAMDMAEIVAAFTQGLAQLSDADSDYVLNVCLAAVQREQAGGGWCRVMTGDQLQFNDIDLAGMLLLVTKVVQHNLSGFFAMLPQIFPGAGRK